MQKRQAKKCPLCAAQAVNVPRHVRKAHPQCPTAAYRRPAQLRIRQLCALCPGVATTRLDQHARKKHGLAGEALAAFVKAARAATGPVGAGLDEMASKAVDDYRLSFLDRAEGGVRRPEESLQHLRSAMKSILPVLSGPALIALEGAGKRGGMVDTMVSEMK